MKRMYFGGFDSWDSVCKNFVIEMPEPQLVFASYGIDCYAGNANVIYGDDPDHLFHVDGSHCSCFGLEGQWEPARFDPRLEKKAIIQNKCTVHFYDDASAEKAWPQWLEENT